MVVRVSARPSHGRVAASVVLVREAFVKKLHGVAGVQRLHAAASTELRLALVEAKRGSAWLPFDQLIEATELADRLFGKGDLALAWQVGRFSAMQETSVVRHLFMSVLSPKAIVDVASALWHHHYDTGRLTTEALGPHAMRVVLSDLSRPHRAHCLSVGGWIESSLEQKKPPGRVLVREETCRTRGGEACRFFLDWGTLRHDEGAKHA